VKSFPVPLLLLLLLTVVQLTAQVQQDLQPHSFSNAQLVSIAELEVEVLPSLDLTSILEEDAVTDLDKTVPWRFGVAVETDLNMNNTGLWEVGKDGTRIWRCRIFSDGALSLNLNFAAFHLPEGASFYVYTPDKLQRLGAFTAANHREDLSFATTIIRGNEVVLEYNLPQHPAFQGSIQLSSVVHGYRSIDKRAEGYGDAGFCNIGINCPEGSGWEKEKRAVVMILADNSNNRVCTGTLINNAREDGTPYVLTANHCPITPNNIFVFNYDSPTCIPPSDGITNETVSGCKLIANNSSITASDFHLVKMNTVPPASYKAYYAGWSSIDQPANYSVSIHHPRGDVKKIALDHQAVQSSGYYGGGNDHWEVLEWDTGTTENASSGAPLFNEQHRIVGQLHGGDAKCLLPVSDYFGKFSYSWDTDSDTLHQLKYWLDPDDTKVNVLDGFDPNSPLLPNDAQMAGLSGIHANVCADSIFPVLRIKNKGSSALNSLQIHYRLDQQKDTLHWTGSLNSNQVATIQLPSLAVTTGNHEFVAVCAAPNGGLDANVMNDLLSMHFFAIQSPKEIEMVLKTDDYGNETSWQLRNALGKVVYSGSGYEAKAGGETIAEQFCLYDGCFEFIIFDAFGDGFCCATGNGSYLLQQLPTGDTIDFNQTFSDSEYSVKFCVGDSCTILVDASVRPVSAPLLTDGSIYIDVIAGNPPFSYQWAHGATNDSLNGLGLGTYTLTVVDSLGCSADFTYEVQLSTGVEQGVSAFEQLTIYPNPSAGTFYLNGLAGKAVEITLYDMLGKQVDVQRISKADESITLNLSHLYTGVYVVMLKVNEEYLVRKLVLNEH
jgi:lysyl endopeptidase